MKKLTKKIIQIILSLIFFNILAFFIYQNFLIKRNNIFFIEMNKPTLYEQDIIVNISKSTNRYMIGKFSLEKKVIQKLKVLTSNNNNFQNFFEIIRYNENDNLINITARASGSLDEKTIINAIDEKIKTIYLEYFKTLKEEINTEHQNNIKFFQINLKYLKENLLSLKQKGVISDSSIGKLTFQIPLLDFHREILSSKNDYQQFEISNINQIDYYLGYLNNLEKNYVKRLNMINKEKMNSFSTDMVPHFMSQIKINYERKYFSLKNYYLIFSLFGLIFGLFFNINFFKKINIINYERK